MGLLSCGGNNQNCTDGSKDPNNCGMCGNNCGATQFCAGGQCTCKPGLTLVNGACVDLQSNPQNCGAVGTICGGNTPVCQNGVCVQQCQGGLDNCNGACSDTNNDPLHCGGCGQQDRCQADEVCVNGNCRNWHLGVNCNTCPCPGECVGNFDQCCPYPGAPGTIACVEGNACPQ